MKFNLLLIFLSFPFNFFGQELDFKFNDTIDLNSDGKSEFISLEKLNDGTYGYRLAINESEIIGNLADPINGFAMIDIDKLDKYKEIAVHTPGPSNDDMFTEVALLAEGSEIQILLCVNNVIKDYNELYLIKSSTGLTGWIDLKGLFNNAELHFAD
jgi:hypothetical protein